MTTRLAGAFTELYHRLVLRELRKAHRLRGETEQMLLGWQHSGFSVHATEPVLPDDTDRLEHLGRYLTRAPLRLDAVQPAQGNLVKVRTPFQPRTGRRNLKLDALELIRRRSWARLLRRIFEVDPLLCPQCGVEMRFVSVIQDATVVDQILAHLHGIGGNDPWEGTAQRGPPAA